VSEDNFKALVADNRVWWGKRGDSIPQIKRFLSEVKQGVTPQTFWSYEEVGHTQEAKQEILKLFGNDVFLTPKPERLMSRIIQIGSNPGDIVLDSFLGSGTTAAVAHKMGRRYIGVEMGDHAVTHCASRLSKVVGGERGGISESAGWNGGGGFRFFRLGEPAFDSDGRIREGIRFGVLAAHIWFSETGTPLNGKAKSPFLGFHGGRAYALLYNGILGDRSLKGGNVLTRETLAIITEKIAKKSDFRGALTVYGEASRLSLDNMTRKGIIFKQTPYEVKARR
jgi:adenine-specific DNA-methyltransferase